MFFSCFSAMLHESGRSFSTSLAMLRRLDPPNMGQLFLPAGASGAGGPPQAAQRNKLIDSRQSRGLQRIPDCPSAGSENSGEPEAPSKGEPVSPLLGASGSPASYLPPGVIAHSLHGSSVMTYKTPLLATGVARMRVAELPPPVMSIVAARSFFGPCL